MLLNSRQKFLEKILRDFAIYRDLIHRLAEKSDPSARAFRPSRRSATAFALNVLVMRQPVAFSLLADLPRIDLINLREMAMDSWLLA
jgi:hypothetical protein